MEMKIQACTAEWNWHSSLIPASLSQNHSASPVPLSISVLSRNPLPMCYQRSEHNSLWIIEHGPGLDALQEAWFFSKIGFCQIKSQASKLLWDSSRGVKIRPSPLHALDFLSLCPCTLNSFKLIHIISNKYLTLRNLTHLPDILFLFFAVVLPSLPSSIRMQGGIKNKDFELF